MPQMFIDETGLSRRTLHVKRWILLLSMLPSLLLGQPMTTNALEKAVRSFEIQRLLAQDSLQTKMVKALNTIATGYQKAGNLEGVLATRTLEGQMKEGEGLAADQSPNPGFERLHQAYTSYQSARNSIDTEAAKTLTAYLQAEGRKVDVAVRELTKQKRLEEAIAAKAALDQIVAMLKEREGQFKDASQVQTLQAARQSALKKVYCYLPFDQQRQGLTPDLGTRRKHGRLMNVALKPGIRKQALAVSGKRSGVQLPVEGFFQDAPGPITMAMWLKPEEDQVDYARILHKLGAKERTPGFILCLNRRKLLMGTLLAGVRGTSWYTEIPLPENEWTHVAISVDAEQQVKAYINGKPTNITPTTLSWAGYGKDQLWLGRRGTVDEGDDERAYKGMIDEFFWFDSVLTDLEVEAISTAAK